MLTSALHALGRAFRDTLRHTFRIWARAFAPRPFTHVDALLTTLERAIEASPVVQLHPTRFRPHR